MQAMTLFSVLYPLHQPCMKTLPSVHRLYIHTDRVACPYKVSTMFRLICVCLCQLKNVPNLGQQGCPAKRKLLRQPRFQKKADAKLRGYAK